MPGASPDVVLSYPRALASMRPATTVTPHLPVGAGVARGRRPDEAISSASHGTPCPAWLQVLLRGCDPCLETLKARCFTGALPQRTLSGRPVQHLTIAGVPCWGTCCPAAWGTRNDYTELSNSTHASVDCMGQSITAMG